MSKVKYVDELPNDGRSTLLATLREVKARGNTGEWAVLKSYDKHLSANDAASRLRRSHPDFTFAARLGTVYAKYEGEST
ncbi:MAG: hypothetical protein DRH08_00650 [Deltaproteobacteria bacterium]|nr:MAG: hypothetical protein DRH08_00650 [Deltaproteobacteria bacterium]